MGAVSLHPRPRAWCRHLFFFIRCTHKVVRAIEAARRLFDFFRVCVCVCVCVYVYLSVCLSVCLSVSVCVCVGVFFVPESTSGSRCSCSSASLISLCRLLFSEFLCHRSVLSGERILPRGVSVWIVLRGGGDGSHSLHRQSPLLQHGIDVSRSVSGLWCVSMPDRLRVTRSCSGGDLHEFSLNSVCVEGTCSGAGRSFDLCPVLLATSLELSSLASNLMTCVVLINDTYIVLQCNSGEHTGGRLQRNQCSIRRRHGLTGRFQRARFQRGRGREW
jgi:hypothetical protein